MTRNRLASSTLTLLFLAGCGAAPQTAPAAPGSPPAAMRNEGAAMADSKAAPSDPGAAGEEREMAAGVAAPPAMAAPATAGAPPPPPSPVMMAPSKKAERSYEPSAAATASPRAPMKPASIAGDDARAMPYVPEPPAAAVKAGEWDDNANYREFQKWMASEQGLPFHRADATDRQFLVVRDADGKAVPRCPVVVNDEQGRRVTLTTTASGRALLFPHAEGLSGRDLTASTSCQNGSASTRFSLAQSDGVIDLKLGVKRVLPPTRDVDLAFILDTTGSMSEEIAAVKATIQKVATALASSNVRLRIGLVEYKDRTDSFVTRVYPMTTDAAKFSRSVAGLSANGGGDTPESMNEGLHVGLTGLEWSGNAVARMAFLIADAPPHLDYANDSDYAVDMREAAHKGIQIFTVAASGMDTLGQVVFRQIAQYTGATNLFVLRGGAGSASTGAGDPKSSCGGTQTAYSSGNLDALIVGKVTRELKGLDRDPLKIAGLRTDENAKPCSDRLMIAE
ncbi:MAG: vWA domain-containing protein [Byssovorax sp.]